jgi:hypothetical protein
MNSLSFTWNEVTSLAVELTKAVEKISLEYAPHGMPMYVTLWRADGTGMRIHSEMHDLEERIEVGVLTFDFVFAPSGHETFVDVASTFGHGVRTAKLVIHQSGENIESGLVFGATNGDEIVIVAGAFPSSLAVNGLLPMPYRFEPEYPIDRYMRVPVT